jgi:hypothetical protein
VSDRPRVLVVVSTPWTYRNLFCTELGPRLSERIDAIYLCFRKDTYEVLRERVGSAPVHLIEWGVSRSGTNQAQWEQFICEAAVAPGRSRLMLLNYRNRKDRSLRHRIRRALGLSRIPVRPRRNANDLRLALAATAAELRKESAAAEVRQLLNFTRPAFIWLGSTFVEGDSLVATIAAETNVPTATTVLGWDNISSKALPPHPSISYTVWGAAMENDLKFYTELVNAKPIVERVGSPQFDVHSRYLQNPTNRSLTAREYGLDPNRPIALYGGSAPLVMPREHELVAELIKRMRETNPELQWLIRLHPKDDGSRWNELRRNAQVAIYQPLKQGDFRDWRPEDEQVQEMVDQIGASNVVVTNASTILLDACILDRPVVANRYEPRSRGVRRSAILFKYAHMEHALGFKAFPVCNCVAEMVEEITRALQHPDERAAARAAFVSEVVAALDGTTTDRILAWLGRVTEMTTGPNLPQYARTVGK